MGVSYGAVRLDKDFLGLMPDLLFDVPGDIGMEPYLYMDRRPLIHPEARSHEIIQVEILRDYKSLSCLVEHLDPVQGEDTHLVSHVAEADQVRTSVEGPDPVRDHPSPSLFLPAHGVIDDLDGLAVQGHNPLRLRGLCDRQSLISFRGIKPLFFFDPFAKPYRHELCVGNTFLSGEALDHRKIKGIHSEGDGLTGRTGNLKRLGIIQQSLNLIGSLSQNLLLPPDSLLFKVFSCFFWNHAHFLTLLK